MVRGGRCLVPACELHLVGGDSRYGPFGMNALVSGPGRRSTCFASTAGVGRRLWLLSGVRPRRRSSSTGFRWVAVGTHGWFRSAGCLGAREFVEELGHVLMVQVQHDAPRPVVLAQDEGRAQADGVTGPLVAHPQPP
jgi:hypothetical protein